MWSRGTEHVHGHAYLPLPLLSRDEEEGVLAGDVVMVDNGQYVGKRGTIEWITPDGRIAVYLDDSVGVGNSVVLMDFHDLRIEPAPHTLSLSKDKGYNVAVGDIVEVARGKWHRCQGVVNTVDFTKALIEMVCSADGKRVSYSFSSLILIHLFIFWPRSLSLSHCAARSRNVPTPSYRASLVVMSGL